MRLYKFTADDEHSPGRVQWGGSKAEGVAFRKEMAEKGYKRNQMAETEVDVPTDKAGLLKWLNEGGAK